MLLRFALFVLASLHPWEARDAVPAHGGGAVADTVPAAASAGVRLFGAEPGSALEDLAIRFRARGEFGGDWTRFRPCDAAVQLTCNPGLVPRLQPDVLFGLEVGGTVGDRLEVDVDYDPTREFAGANRFRVAYRGAPGELLQHAEVGDVTFALPDSRFIARGIPADNFGVLARARAGGVTFQALAAQQRGSREHREFRLGRDDAGVIREDTLVLDDAAYVQGQFFFVADPRRIARYPHLDILDLRPADAPPSEAPGPVPIQLWRMEREPVMRQQVEGYVRADAEAEGEDGAVVRESGWFRFLRPGVDYHLHHSGLWVALRIPLRPDEALAVSYITVRGDTVGQYNPERIQAEGGVPRLRLLRATRPRHQPGRATWDREMRQVYRLSSSDEVELETVRASISLGEESGGQTFKRRPDGRAISFLRLFGLDEHAPFEAVDRVALFQPGREAFEGIALPGTFLVFPTLEPFRTPPPLPSEGLSAEQVREILGGDANRRIYDVPDPFEREAGGLFRLNVSLRIRSEGVTSTFALGAFGIREGSERLFLGDRLLRPQIDYLIDYEVGVVTLLSPEFLLARSSSDRLQVTWEQMALFRPRPTTLLGGTASIPLGGGTGALDLLGLYQVEREVLTRPRFGAEPAAAGMIGTRTRWGRELPALDGFLHRLLGGEPGESERHGSELRLEGELAMSLPNPNVSGDAYIDDFDAADERSVSLLSTAWHLGSAAAFRDGADEVLPEVIDEESALDLVWQHTWIERGADGDSVGVFEGLFPRSDIDRRITIVGSQVREPGLLLHFGREPGSSFETPRWRSVTTLLSPTGADLTQTEFLDFYVADGDSLTLVLDLGLVSEDALFIDAAGRTSGFRTDTGRPWGLGVLDQEADPLRGEIWSPAADARGVWPEECEAEQGRVYPIGDPRANCTRGNGRRDTEDLNGNGVLDTEERYARYVVRLDGSSPYLVRNRLQTGTRFRLYRIPLRGPGAVYPSGVLSQADWRNVQFLRMTVTGRQATRLTLARMRLVGSRWLKRGGEGVLTGIGGDTVAFAGSLEVTPVGVLSEGPAYQAPPGVLEQLDDPQAALGGRGIELSERSLALRFQGLGGGDRAEVYFRFLQRPRDFLSYRQLRLWAVARHGDWGAGRPTDFFLKVGSDPENFYLWRTPLAPARDPGGVTPEDWLPEGRIDFDEWIALRRRAEERLIQSPTAPGSGPVVEWSADSTYAVVLEDRARAPNLAAVREISLGVWNRDGVPIDGEVWINELRLGGGVRTPGTARFVNLELDGGDLLQIRAGYEGQGARFRTMEVLPSFQREDALHASGTVQLGGLLPAGLGIDLPLSLSHFRTSSAPLLLDGTDIEAARLPGLRSPGTSETRAALTLRMEGTTGREGLDRALSTLDARVQMSRAEGRTITTESHSSGVEVGLGFRLRPEARRIPLVPGFLEPVVRILLPPGMARRVNEADVRWTPEELRMGTTLRRRELRITRFDEIIELPGADPGSTAEAPEAWLDSRARIAFQPGGTLTGSLEVVSERDLLDPTKGVLDPRVRPLVDREHLRVAGIGLGWETRRDLLVRLGLRPELFRGVRADLSGQTRFGTERNAGLVRFDPLAPAGPGDLLRNVRVDRDLRAGMTLDPQRLLGLQPPAPDEAGEGLLAVAARAVSPISLTLQDGLVAAFFREAVDPGATFQLGFGGFETFRSMDGVGAATLARRRSFAGGSGLRLPASLFINANVQRVRLSSLDRRSERDGRTRTWPDVRAGASDLPVPEAWRPHVQRIAVTSGLQRVHEDVSYGGAELQARTRHDSRVPLELAVEWAAGLTARYRATIGWGDGTDPTGATRRESADHGVALETRFQPRTGLELRPETGTRLAIVASHSVQRECRIATGRQECVPFLDHVIRTVSVSVDAVVAGLEMGSQASFLDRRTYTGIRSGLTQFQVGVWARMDFTAGPVERLDLRRREPFGR